jgi:hypothetical protein
VIVQIGPRNSFTFRHWEMELQRRLKDTTGTLTRVVAFRKAADHTARRSD